MARDATKWVKRTCAYCGIEFDVRVCWSKNGQGKFCSIACQRNGRIKPTRNLVEVICAICGSVFYVREYRRYTAVTCSNECRAIYCGILKRKEIKGRYTWDRSYQRKAWAKAVLERDNYTCQRCGSTENLRAHHIFWVSECPSVAGELWNGVTLCETCHIKEHGGEVSWQKQEQQGKHEVLEVGSL